MQRWYRILCPLSEWTEGFFYERGVIVEISEKALGLHDRGFNCAQSVLCACSEYTGLDSAMAEAVSAGFGGGMRSGEVCGAISGAIMALGCRLSRANPDIFDSKMQTANATRECVKRFREKYGCIRCLELKKAGISCDDLIAFGAEQAEAILNNKHAEE